MMDLKPAFEYVKGKNLLNDCRFSGNIGIGRFEPVVDICKTKNAIATKRPTLPPTTTKKNIIAINVKLVKTENKINVTILSTCSCKNNKANIETSKPCAIANIDKFINLLAYQLKAEPGVTTGFLKSITKDNMRIPTNKASESIYGAVESR